MSEQLEFSSAAAAQAWAEAEREIERDFSIVFRRMENALAARGGDTAQKGGPGSGYFNEPGAPHRGRPGERGGSLPTDGTGGESSPDGLDAHTEIARTMAGETPQSSSLVPLSPNANAPTLGRRDVAESLNLDGLKPAPRRAVDRALSAIRKVHSIDERLPTIPVGIANTPDNAGASFHFNQRSARDKAAIGIFIANPSAQRNPAFIVHEIGHFLDASVLSVGIVTEDVQMSQAQESATQNFYHVAFRTKAMKAMLGGLNNAGRSGAHFQVAGGSVSVDPELLIYLRDGREVFARAYAQWVALRSGDTELMDMVRVSKDKNPKLTEFHATHMQWTDDDFAPLAEAMDKLFEAHGLRAGGMS